MKKSKFLLITLLLISGCNKIDLGSLETSIYIASDLHLYSNNLIGKDNVSCVKDKFTSDGRVQEYDYELVESLVNKVNKNKPDYLVLSGDLSYNGEKDSHLELVKLLDNIEDTKVLVIPGNHDTYSLNSFSCLEDKVVYTETIDHNDFREIYKNYGYQNAYSYDQDTLSYIYEISEDKWLIMLDTNQSKYNEEFGMNIVGGCIYENTYNWMESNLKYAKENNIEVISVTHHNLLVHNKLFKTSYTLFNNEDILNLLVEYDVKLNLSGHLHIQSIKNTLINEKEIYDISSGSLLDYGNRYGVLNIYENYLDYESKKVTFIDENLDFDKYSYDVFYNKYYNKSLYRNEVRYGEDGEEITSLLSEINCYYFDGDYVNINKVVKKNKSLINLIKEKSSDYENEYVGTIIEVENKNQHSLLIKR